MERKVFELTHKTIKDRHFSKPPNLLPKKNRRFQKIVSNFLLKVEFDLKNRFLGIVARKPSMGS
jgi:hypothetical protein